MKKKISVFGLTILLLVAFAGMLWANAGTPGSNADPLVTRSFVEDYVKGQLGQGSQSGGQWLIEEIDAGGVFKGGSGTEMVLRSGKATVIDPSKSGILDITVGGNVVDGQAVPANHLLIIPKDDGRGLKATTDIIVMYKGSGSVKYN
ncbi:hypothetical protein V6C27_01815 [Peptococcaceae bacterium 1198_IL3148]